MLKLPHFCIDFGTYPRSCLDELQSGASLQVLSKNATNLSFANVAARSGNVHFLEAGVVHAIVGMPWFFQPIFLTTSCHQLKIMWYWCGTQLPPKQHASTSRECWLVVCFWLLSTVSLGRLTKTTSNDGKNTLLVLVNSFCFYECATPKSIAPAYGKFNLIFCAVFETHNIPTRPLSSESNAQTPGPEVKCLMVNLNPNDSTLNLNLYCQFYHHLPNQNHIFSWLNQSGILRYQTQCIHSKIRWCITVLLNIHWHTVSHKLV